MSQTSSITLDSVFQAPIVRAQFDVLLVLADAIDPSLPDLYQTSTNWHRGVAAAAEALAKPKSAQPDHGNTGQEAQPNIDASEKVSE